LTVEDLVHINLQSWKELLDNGINFAAEVCGSYDNYISDRRFYSTRMTRMMRLSRIKIPELSTQHLTLNINACNAPKI